jgi:hypothetical protein
VDRLPTILINTLREQWNGLVELDKQIAQIERRLQTWMKEDKACKAIAAYRAQFSVGVNSPTYTVLSFRMLASVPEIAGA